jgi:hypothetical protein
VTTWSTAPTPRTSTVVCAQIAGSTSKGEWAGSGPRATNPRQSRALPCALVKGKQAEGRDERWAREIVKTILGVPVERFDDGTAPRQVDALVHYPDRLAALEIVTDPDKPFHSLQAELDRENPIKVPGLRESWVAVLLSRESWMVVLSPEAKITKIKAKIKKIKQELPALLLALQDNPSPKREPLGYRTFELHRLGIISAKPIDNSTAPGRVWLTLEAWGAGRNAERTVGERGGDGRSVGEWVTEVLVKKAPDVPEKLAAHPGVAERHAFIWAIPTSDRGVLAQLDPGDDYPLPVTAPTLPAGITHVWVAGHWCRGVLAWFPGRGWSRTPLGWSLEGPVTESTAAP